jgi:small subunit ribosomal protein S9
MAGEYFEGVGRRKTSVARVRLMPGGNSVVINDKPVEEYFGREADRFAVDGPLAATGTQGRYAITVKVSGGGITGQAAATQMGVARALLAVDPNFRSALRQAGFLSRDARAKERKKPGLKRARKASQYTKR